MVLDDDRALEGLTDTDIEIDGTRFFIAKLPAMAAFDLMELMRHELGKSQSGAVSNDGSDAMLPGLINMVMSLDPAFVSQVRRKLFERVSFSNQRAPTPQQLAGAEDMAFDGLEPVAVYEVLVRSLAVNFTPSLRALGSRLGDADLSSILSGRSA